MAWEMTGVGVKPSLAAWKTSHIMGGEHFQRRPLSGRGEGMGVHADEERARRFSAPAGTLQWPA